MALHLGCDDQTLFVGGIDRKRRAAARPYRRMALFNGQFDVVRVKIAARDDDEIFQTTGDKQFAILEESQIPGAQKWSLTGVRQVGPERRLGLFGLVPIAFVDTVGPETQISPTAVRRASASTIQDRTTTIVVSGIGVAHPTSVRIFCCWSETSATRFCSSAAA